jgi:hypothetical protein
VTHAVLVEPLTEADLVVHLAVLRIAQCIAEPPKALEVEATVQAPRATLGFPAEIAPDDGCWGLLNWWRAERAHPESRVLVATSP